VRELALACAFGTKFRLSVRPRALCRMHSLALPFSLALRLGSKPFDRASVAARAASSSGF
jgi:hypothetical protein